MFCTQCGNQVPDGMAFCNQCGAKMPGQMKREAILDPAPAPEVVPEQPVQELPPQNPYQEPNAGPQNGSQYSQDTQPWNTAYGNGPTGNMNGQGGGYYGAPPQGWGPQPYNASPVVNEVKRSVGGAAFLVMTLCLTVLFVLILIPLFQTYSTYSRLGMSTEASAYLIILLIVMIPPVLLIIGTWMMWGSSKGPSPVISGTGLVKATMIIYAVLIILGIIAYVVYIIYTVSRYARVLNEYKRFYGSGIRIGDIYGDGWTIFWVVNVIVLLILLLALIYYFKIVKVCNIVRDSVLTGTQTSDVPVYISVINIIVLVFLSIGLIALIIVSIAEKEIFYDAMSELNLPYTASGTYMTTTMLTLILNIVALISFTAFLSSLKRAFLLARRAEYYPPNNY